MKKLVSLLLILVVATPVWAYGRKIQLNTVLKKELNQVLKATDELHEACFDQDEPLISAKLRSVIKAIDAANDKIMLADTQKIHLDKLLKSAKSDLEKSQMSSGKERRDSLKSAFHQIVTMVKTYKLDPYKIFFCPKDRSVWIQKSWKAKNPINPKKYGSCGRPVR